MREAVAESERPVMLYSVGKDSAVMLHLARKAFYPSPPPFPLLHVDTTWKFRAMYEFRDRMAAEARHGAARLPEPRVRGARHQPVRPRLGAAHRHVEDRGAASRRSTSYGFDCAFGGARRDEEKSRAKERVFSIRSAQHRWDPKQPAARAVATSTTRARSQGESDPGVPAVELDRARRLAVHPPRAASRSCRCTSPRRGRWSSATAR